MVALLDLGEAFGLLVLASVLLAAAVALRSGVLRRRWSTVPGSVRILPAGRGLDGWPRSGPDRCHWALGVGAYDEDVLRWYRLVSLRARPVLELDRRLLEVVGRRCPLGPERRRLVGGHLVITVDTGRGPELPDLTGIPPRLVELAISPGAATGFTAWLETASRPAHPDLTQPDLTQPDLYRPAVHAAIPDEPEPHRPVDPVLGPPAPARAARAGASAVVRPRPGA